MLHSPLQFDILNIESEKRELSSRGRALGRALRVLGRMRARRAIIATQRTLRHPSFLGLLRADCDAPRGSPRSFAAQRTLAQDDNLNRYRVNCERLEWGIHGIRVSSMTKKARAKPKAKSETKSKAKSKRAARKAATTTTTTTTTTTSSSSTTSSTDKQPVDLAEVRKDITNIVGSSAAALTRAVVGIGLTGQLAPVKYLFEVTGLYPATESIEAKPDQEALAHTLMRRMNLTERPIASDDDEDAHLGISKPVDLPAVQAAGDKAQVKQTGNADSGTCGTVEHSHGEQRATAERAGTIP
jgi:hypothetical protein